MKLGAGSDKVQKKLCSLDNFSCLEAFHADIDPLDGPFDHDLDLLQIGTEGAKRFTDDLGTRTAGPLDLTASFIMLAGNRAFVADFTNFRHCRFPACRQAGPD